MAYTQHSKAYYKWRNFVWRMNKIKWFFEWLFIDLPRNYRLVKKYPFLRPSCGWSVDMEYWKKDYRYHYEETWLDAMPDGWRKAFGKQLCDELQAVIVRDGLKDYAVHQVKEKWGFLNWYDEGGNKATNEILEKYEDISRQVCIQCGKPAEYVTTGWISYYCGNCVKSFKDGKYKRISEHGTI